MMLLHKILYALDKSELRQLKKFVASPFVTHRKELALLYNVLAKCCYQDKAFPSKEVLFQEVFGAAPYDDQRLRSIMSDLHRIVEKYLEWVSFRQGTIDAQVTLLGTYRKRGLNKHFGRSSRKIAQQLEQQTFRNTGYYQDCLSYQLETHRFQTTTKRTGQLNLQEVGDTMDILYLAQKLRHVCSQLSHRAVYQTDYQFGLLNEWIDVVEDPKYLKIPAIALYYYCYRFLTEAYSQVYFRQFRKHLHQYYQQFPQDELKDLYRAAINFCIRKLNEGDLDFTREGWELYQEGLTAGYFIENNQLSRFTFDNIVGFGLRLQEFNAVADFISNYEDFVAPEYRVSTIYFNLARLEYSRQNFDQALLYLQNAHPKDLVNQLILKTIQLKIYYESEEINLLESHLDSFRQFIRRKEISDYHRSNYQNIISYTRKLMATAPYNNKDRTRLKQAVEREEILSERLWLLEKIG